MAVLLVDPRRLVKSPGQKGRFWIDFEACDEIANGDTFTPGTPTITATPSGLTITNKAIDTNPDTGEDTRLAADFEAGANGVNYLVTMSRTTVGGALLERSVYLEVATI